MVAVSTKEIVRCPLTGDEAVLVDTIAVDTIVSAYRDFDQLIGPLDVQRFFTALDAVEVYESPSSGYRFYHPFDISGDEAFYGRLSAFPWYYAEDKWEHDVAVRAVQSSDRVLEFGCGRGAFLRRAAAKGARVTGIELNSAAAQFCAAQGLEVHTRRIEDMAAEHASEFDVVASFQVVEHLADPLTVLSAACRLLREGGLLVVSVPNNDSMLFETFNLLNVPPHHMGRWNVKALLWLQRSLPLRVVDLRFESLANRLPLDRLSARAAQHVHARSLKHRVARRVLGDQRSLLVAAPWVQAALELAPGHTVQAIYERL